MENLSERVQREFNEWKEKYEIPHHMEFQIKTLLKLQEEYDGVEAGSNTTKTRETLLHMISELQNRMSLKEKQPESKPMYVDVIRKPTDMLKVILYYDENITVLDNDKFTMKDYASIINSTVGNKNTIVYIDIRGYGMALHDELLLCDNLTIKQLKNVKPFYSL